MSALPAETLVVSDGGMGRLGPGEGFRDLLQRERGGSGCGMGWDDEWVRLSVYRLIWLLSIRVFTKAGDECDKWASCLVH